MSSLAGIIGTVVYPAICVIGIGYNSLLMINGPEGSRVSALLEAEIVTETVRKDSLDERFHSLTARADRLLLARLDEDLLEERVRSVLGLVSRDEYMIRMSDLDILAGRRAGSEEIQKDSSAIRIASQN